jgi:hypothetical protein
MSEERRFNSFAEFYPFYLDEHANRASRRLHFIGTTVGIGLVVAAVVTWVWWLAVLAWLQGYAFAWVGHFFFEHNKPATFKYPGYSFMGDWRLWWEILTRKQPF